MKILILATGGTIGSVVRRGVISAAGGSEGLLVSLYRERYSDEVDFTVRRIADTLSENITDAFYETLLRELLRSDCGAFDGVLVLHGTDTLPYTAALAAEALAGLSVPVGFVSADLPLTDERSNGVDNFRAALQYLRAGGRGFFVPYRNRGKRTLIHRARKLLEADFSRDGFYSLGDDFAARIDGDRVVFGREPDVKARGESAAGEGFRLTKKILLIKGFPGLDYSVFDLRGRQFAAVLHTAYHSGTASAAPAPHSLPAFAKKCAENGIDSFIAGLSRRESIYESADAVFKSGVRPLYDMTIPAALARLKVACNQTRLSPAEYLRGV